MESLWQDLQYAARQLRRSPGFAVAIALTFALGVGANAAVFSFLDRFFLRPPAGVRDPGTIRRLYANYPALPWATNGLAVAPVFTYPEFRTLRTVLDRGALAAYTTDDSVLIGHTGGAVPARVSYVTQTYFPLLGVRPALGRFFAPDEDSIEVASPVAVLSYALWRRAFGGDSSVVGRVVAVDSGRATIVGVAPPRFAGMEVDAAELWRPLNTFTTSSIHGRPWYLEEGNVLHLVTRVASSAAEAHVRTVGTVALQREQSEAYRRTDSTSSILLGTVNAATGPASAYLPPELTIAKRLQGVAIILLLIACANVSNLLLLRAMRRRREIAVRLALGVTRARLCRQLLTESVALALIGGAAALLVATWGGATLRRVLLPQVHWADVAIDARVMAFAAAGTLLAGLVAGLAPAIRMSRPDLVQSLKEGALASGPQRSRLRSFLLIAQTALSLVLVVGAGLFVRSLEKVTALPLGYDTDRLIFAEVRFDNSTQHGAELRSAFPEVAARLAAVAGVEGVALSSNTPMRGYSFVALFLPDRDSIPLLNRQRPTMLSVSPSFFRTTGLQIKAGRSFVTADRAGAPPVVIVNETMAKVFWPGENALTKCIILHKRTDPCASVAGVVADARRGQVVEAPTMQYFIPLDQEADLAPTSLVIRTGPEHATAVRELARREVERALPGAGRARVMSMAQILAPQIRSWRLGAALFSAFGLLALLIASVGIYSVVAYTFSQRAHEVGVRIALGAQTHDVLRLVLSEGLRIVAVGVAAGTVLALVLGRLIASLLYGVTPRDPPVLGAAALILLVVGLIASVGPGWRAARVDPVTALRAN